jgi:hypothetical protein
MPDDYVPPTAPELEKWEKVCAIDTWYLHGPSAPSVILRLIRALREARRNAACPCCVTHPGKGINIKGEICQECHGTALLEIAYESLRVHYKFRTEEIAALEADKRRLDFLERKGSPWRETLDTEMAALAALETAGI